MRVASDAVREAPVVVRRLRAGEVGRVFKPVDRARGVEWLAAQERGELYVAVAEVDGAPVGHRCLDCVCGREWSVGFLFGASVMPEWQSRGIGSHLDAHLEEVARSLGLGSLRCVNAKWNFRALRWHERLGYRRIGERTLRWIGREGHEVAVDCWELERPVAPLAAALSSAS